MTVRRESLVTWRRYLIGSMRIVRVIDCNDAGEESERMLIPAPRRRDVRGEKAHPAWRWKL